MDYFTQNSMPESSVDNILVNEFGMLHLEPTYPNFFPSNLNSPPSDDPSPSSGSSSEVCSATLSYISDMLMEEDLENHPYMLQDCLALQAAEKSLHDVLNQRYPCSSDHPLGFSTHQNDVDDSDDFVNHNSNSSTAPTNWDDSGMISLQNVLDSSPADYDTSLVPLFSNEKDDSTTAADMFDVLLCRPESPMLQSCSPILLSEIKDGNGKLKQSGGNTKGSKRKKRQDDNIEVVDFHSLLTLCAKAVSSYDQRNANKLLKQIRRHSSPYGDGTQRLAHYFAIGLEERLTAPDPSRHKPLSSTKRSAADLLTAYQSLITACPFKLMSSYYANQTIAKLAEKSTSLHIIDFGILSGFQWPWLIQFLSKRPGGPPNIRITGIEFPQSGFHPSERLEETGRRLGNYCKRFDVKFEYHFIARNWETIQCEDIRIDRDEFTVVNCMGRLQNLLPDDVVRDSPRDTVLKLIKRIKPDVFIHSVVNGTHNAPFFEVRFREALHQFSSLFDMIEETFTREDPQRLDFEQEVLGKLVINVIACEGSRRLERPETYKQWHVRNTRAGFKQLPLNQEILKKVKTMVKSDYHKDFVVDKDCQWVLQGWKGRIIYAISCWKPA